MGLDRGKLNVELPSSMQAERRDGIAILRPLPGLLDRRAAKMASPSVARLRAARLRAARPGA